MLTNATQEPRIFYCRHMQPGIARYENETILVDSDGMKNLVASVGKRAIPVYINHQDVDLKNIKEKACGYVSDSFYNELDGWAWFKFVAVDDQAHEAVRKGWSVSNAYMPSDWGPAGTKNNCPYHREVRNGEFTHLAIVPDPRYEGACIMTPEEFKNYQDTAREKLAELKNSKEKKPMFKMFKNEKKEVTGSAVDLDTHIELENGKSISIREMVEAVVENSKEEASIEVGGKKMTLSELAKAYENAMKKKKMKKNGSEEETPHGEDEDVEGDQDDEGDDEIGTDKKNKKMKKNKKEKKNKADDEEDDCMNNDAEDGEDEDKKEKKNSSGKDNKEVEVDDKFFTELKNAHLNPPNRDKAPMVVTSIDGIARGKQRYGSASGSNK